MTEAFKRLNAKVEALLQENTKLMEQIKSLKEFSISKKWMAGVHSPTNAKRSTVSDNKDTNSPDQAVPVKTHQTRLWAVTLPKVKVKVLHPAREEDYGEHSYYQDAQNPNADDDSGMSFDSEALHNLDT
ncbi:hypothetical protein H5410_052579 [Solanum commersonii]|uniref:Uncharacterized protein n=1 Tax=Solanum commersonii TaxID=4109 RepID=A0A9J5X4I3_SOLCO|nr:hypothetical protein H5410_052579 [Solanum commersonii]